MNLNCVIIDDEPLAQELLQSYIEKTPFLNLKGVYSSAVQAMKEMASQEAIHLMFLDIQMPVLSSYRKARQRLSKEEESYSTKNTSLFPKATRKNYRIIIEQWCIGQVQ